MSPEDHDREAATTQGLTHLVGRVLAEMQLRPSAIGSLGYQKLLEIIEQTCNDSWQLFLDLQRFNRYTREMRRRLEDSLARIRARLDSDDSPPQ
jgi:prephenate dehydrogenase